MSAIDTPDRVGSRPAGINGNGHAGHSRRLSTETKAAFKTTEFFAFLAILAGILVSAAVVDVSDFGAQEAWLYATILTVGYMISRGLAKAGSRDPDDDRS